MIPPKEYAEMVGAKYQTVMLWLRQDLIPGAQRFDLPAGGHYYVIPENAPKPETRRGPKPKKEGAKKAKKAKQGALFFASRVTSNDVTDDATEKKKPAKKKGVGK
jgi:hypothetical protein